MTKGSPLGNCNQGISQNNKAWCQKDCSKPSVLKMTRLLPPFLLVLSLPLLSILFILNYDHTICIPAPSSVPR